MNKLASFAATFGLALGLASSAQAGTVTVNYALTGQVNAVGLPLPPIALLNGLMSVSFTGASINSISAGPMAIAGSGTSTISVNLAGFGIAAVITGAVPTNLFGGVGSLAGLTASGLQSFGWLGSAHCTGAGCGSVLGLPISVPFPVGASGTGAFALTLASATGNNVNVTMPWGNLTILVPLALTLSATGTEVSRSFVPEPGSALMLAIGLAGLTICVFAARRYTRG